MKPASIFVGYDSREAIGFHVFVESLLHSTNQPLGITPLSGEQRDGTNRFIYARFLVPYFCDFQGSAIFLDGSDMLMRADIAELSSLADETHAVQVVQHEYRTRHPRKYLGTDMEADNADYPRKNWSSAVIWNCGHPSNRILTPEFIDRHDGAFLHRFSWLRDDEIGALPKSWNVLIGEENQSPEAHIAHYTLGIPAFAHYRHDPYADEWHALEANLNSRRPRKNVRTILPESDRHVNALRTG